MSQENINDPKPHEGDQAEEMKEEGSPVEPSTESFDTQKDAVDRELEIFQDMQRLQADFVNYRTRVERDRGAERQAAVAEAIRAFLPAFDDLTRAETHGDLVEGSPMAAIFQKLKAAGDKFGLKRFGEKGDKFDPERHDALIQTPSAEVSEPIIADVVEHGYLLGDRMIRPAKVAVFVSE
jgi:molecular chaperone GrpE